LFLSLEAKDNIAWTVVADHATLRDIAVVSLLLTELTRALRRGEAVFETWGENFVSTQSNLSCILSHNMVCISQDHWHDERYWCLQVCRSHLQEQPVALDQRQVWSSIGTSEQHIYRVLYACIVLVHSPALLNICWTALRVWTRNCARYSDLYGGLQRTGS